MWGDPEPTPGEVDADLGYKTRWKNSCYPSPSWTAQPQAAQLAPAAEGKVKVWKEVAALGDRGIKQPRGICCLLHLSQFPSSQEQQGHLCGLLIPVGRLLQHFWIFFLTFKISWQTPGMEVRLRRAKLDWERSEDPGITAQNVSHTLHALRVYPPALGFAARHKETSHPCLCVEWVSITAGLGDPVHVGHPSKPFSAITAHVCNQTCSDPYPVLRDVIPYQLLLISFFLSLLASFRHIQILRLLHQMRCDPLPPDTDWGKLGTKSPLHIR